MRTWNVNVEPVDGGAIVSASQQELGGDEEYSQKKVIVAGDITSVLFNRRMRKALIGLVKEAFPIPEKNPVQADLPGQTLLPGVAAPTA